MTGDLVYFVPDRKLFMRACALLEWMDEIVELEPKRDEVALQWEAREEGPPPVRGPLNALVVTPCRERVARLFLGQREPRAGGEPSPAAGPHRSRSSTDRASEELGPPAPVCPHPVWWPQNAPRGDPTRTDQRLSPMGPIQMAQGWQKISKNRVGSSAAKNSLTDAVTTADISLTVRAYDHAGLGSPPPSTSGYRAASECPPRRCSFPATPFPLSQRFRAQARLPLRDRTSLTPKRDRGERVRVTSC